MTLSGMMKALTEIQKRGDAMLQGVRQFKIYEKKLNLLKLISEKKNKQIKTNSVNDI